MSEQERVYMVSEFKARCLAIVDQVSQSRVPVLITKHGRPVARLVPIDEDKRRSTMGSVGLVAAEDVAYYSTDEPWEASDR